MNVAHHCRYHDTCVALTSHPLVEAALGRPMSRSGRIGSMRRYTTCLDEVVHQPPVVDLTMGLLAPSPGRHSSSTSKCWGRLAVQQTTHLEMLLSIDLGVPPSIFMTQPHPEAEVLLETSPVRGAFCEARMIQLCYTSAPQPLRVVNNGPYSGSWRCWMVGHG